ncbi:MAG: ABC transporter permease subunit [Eubacteriales bacterium]|nr:ABC transporter permease subunit [Eubacteriales bacterium]
MKKLPGWVSKTMILFFWILVWQLFAVLIHNHILLVGPLETLRTFFSSVVSPDFWAAIRFSLGRILLGFGLAFLAGLATGALSARFPLAGELLELPIQLMKSIPVASFVILALIWAGSKNLSVLISFAVVYPILHISTRAGIAAADKGLLEMAQVFRVPFLRRAFYIYRPALFPYLASACRTALGMAFKSGIAAEVIGVPDGSVGEGLYQAKIYLDTAGLFSWTLTIVLLAVILEKILLRLLTLAAGKGARHEASEI